MRARILLVLMLVLAGCSDNAPQPVHDVVESASVRQPVPNSPVLARTMPDGTDDPAETVVIEAETRPPTARLALDGEGLRIFDIATGSSRPIPFGIEKAEALDMLQAVQGAPPGDQGENIDCVATYASWPDGLTVWFARGEFVGWSVASMDSSLSSAGGLKLGATRSEVENGASVAEIAPSSLGEEFTAGGVAGLLDSPEADAHVTNLWAGAVCLAR